jgi:hypothetical protein
LLRRDRSGRGMAVSLWSNISGGSTLCGSGGAVPNPDRDETGRAAAGERIVAFARPGKPPEIRLVGGSEPRPPFGDRTNPREVSTVPKASWRKVAASGAMG